MLKSFSLKFGVVVPHSQAAAENETKCEAEPTVRNARNHHHPSTGLCQKSEGQQA